MCFACGWRRSKEEEGNVEEAEAEGKEAKKARKIGKRKLKAKER